MRMKLILALGMTLGIGAATRIATLPPYDPAADVGKVPAIGPSGSILWSTASSVSGAVVGPTSAGDNSLAQFDGTSGKLIEDSGIPSANVVLVSRAVQAGTGLVVTNSGLLTADITMSLSSATGATGPLAVISPQTTKGDLIAYSTLPIRLAVGATGTILQSDSTAAAGVSWTQDKLGVTTNSDAAAGYIGQVLQIVQPRASAPALTTNTACNVGAATCPSTGGTQSITLTPGDWDCHGAIGFIPTATTSVTNYTVATSVNSATLPGLTNSSANPTTVAGDLRMNFSQPAAVDGAVNGRDFSIPSFRVSKASSGFLYLVAQATFTASTLGVYGYLQCRRIR